MRKNLFLVLLCWGMASLFALPLSTQNGNSYSKGIEKDSFIHWQTNLNYNWFTMFNLMDCMPSFSSSTDYIESFQLEEIHNMNSGFSAGGYGDFTAMSTNLVQGQNHTVVLLSSFGSGTHGVAVWIDLNDDGDFDDSERLGYANGIEGSETKTFFVNIPSDAVLGEHRMRVVYQYLELGENINPCASASWGEGEDYTVNIIENTGEPTDGPCLDKTIMECGITYTAELLPSG